MRATPTTAATLGRKQIVRKNFMPRNLLFSTEAKNNAGITLKGTVNKIKKTVFRNEI